MSIESDPCPKASVQEGKSAYYKEFLESETRARAKLMASLSWFHPVDRLLRTPQVRRQIRHCDRVIAIAESALEQSRQDDARIIIGEPVMQIDVQAEQPPRLANDPAANHSVAIV